MAAPTTRLRRIAVHVDEPTPGRFYWVLAEQGDDASQWKEFASAGSGCEMWLDALHAGVRALESHARDERIGPRTAGPAGTGEDEDAAPVGRPAS